MTAPVTSVTFSARRQAWFSQLRIACLVVSGQPPQLIKSISVTERFTGVSVEERRELITLALRVAGEYDLTAEPVDRGSPLTVLLFRRVAVRPQEAGGRSGRPSSRAPKQGLLARVRRLLRLVAAAPPSDRPAPEEGPDGTHAALRDEDMVKS